MSEEQISLEAMQAMYAQETDEVVLACLTLDHPDLVTPVRVVADALPLITGSATVADMTGNGHDGAVNGELTWVRSLIGGGFGTALEFSGDDADHVLTPVINLGNTWTIEVPVKVSTLVPAQQIFMSFGLPYLSIDSTGNFRVSWNNSTPVQKVLSEVGGNRVVGKTYHVAATHEANTTVLYVDGVEVARQEIDDSANVNAVMWMGRHSGAGYPFNGTLGEVRVWNRARSAKEIHDDQATMISAATPGLVAYYTTNDGCFMPYPFNITAPDEVADETPQVQLSIDNVDRVIVEMLRSLSSPATVTLEIVLASSPDVVEHGPFAMTLRKADYDALVVTGSLDFGDELDATFPAHTMTPSTAPGLY